MRDKVTVPAIQARKGGTKIKMVTAYDAPTARIADRALADIILVGDSLATAVLGYDDTLSATVDIMIAPYGCCSTNQTWRASAWRYAMAELPHIGGRDRA